MKPKIYTLALLMLAFSPVFGQNENLYYRTSRHCGIQTISKGLNRPAETAMENVQIFVKNYLYPRIKSVSTDFSVDEQASERMLCTDPGDFSLTNTNGQISTQCAGDNFDYGQSITFNWGNSFGAECYDLNVSKYPYGTVNNCNPNLLNLVFQQDCIFNPSNFSDSYTTQLSSNNNFVPGMLYRWNVNAFDVTCNGTCKTNSGEVFGNDVLYFYTRPVIQSLSSTTICEGQSVVLQSHTNVAHAH